MAQTDTVKRKILIADDSPTVTGILSYIFSDQGYLVETAADGVEAIRRFYQSPPDLLILDIEMPRMNGYQVSRVLRNDPEASDIPIVMLTSRDLQSDKFHGIISGADAYIVKNLEDDQLLNTVNEFLAQRANPTSLRARSISEAEILQTVNQMLDRRLFISTVTGEVERANAKVSDYSETQSKILDLFGKVFEYVAGGIFFKDDGALVGMTSILDGYPESLQDDFIKAASAAAVKNEIVEPLDSMKINIRKHKSGGSRHFPKDAKLLDVSFWPLNARGEVFGLIGMGGTAPLKFDLEGNELLMEFIARAEIVLDNAILVEAQRRAKAKIEKALEDLKQAQAQLVQSEKMASLGQLMAGLTHEMNNPLTFIAGNLDHLDNYTHNLFRLTDTCLQGIEENALVGKVKDEVSYDFMREDFPGMLRDLREGVNRARRIISDLRTFSAMDRGEVVYADLGVLIESSLNVLRHEWQPLCSVVKDIKNTPPYECNSGLMGQVILNLLSNAILAIKENGKKGILTISLKADQENLWLSIADDGVGIAPENMSKLFQPFFTTREVGKGMGLGLAISYGIVKKHGGDIKVSSTHGAGTTFTLVLPLTHEMTNG